MQEKNVAYLDPMHIAIQEAVMKSLKGKNSLLNKKKVIKFVQREEEILAVCLANYLLFSPMSAWDFQIKGLCHQGVEKKGRLPNLIKLETHMSFVNPLMKGPKENNKCAEVLWALAEMICKPFAFSMGVLRPAVTMVL